MPHLRRVGASLVALCVATLAGGRVANGQSILGPGETALTVPRGVLRTSLLIDLARYDERFVAGSTAEPLGTDFSVQSLGARQLPSLLATQDSLRTATGGSDVTLSLGRLGVTEDARVTTIPFQVEFGFTRWLTAGAVIPIVRSRTTVALTTPDDGAGANASVNPALRSETQQAAKVANGAVQTQLAAASAALRSQLEACKQNPASSPKCGDVLIDSVHVKSLADSATAIAAALKTTYGDGLTGGSAYVPLSGSAAQLAVDARLASLGTSAASFLDGGAPISARPAAALGPLTASQAQEAFATDFFNADPIRSIDRIDIGDIELGAKILLLDAASVSPSSRRPVGFRLAVAPIFRIGSFSSDAPFNWFDIPPGDGQNDVEIRGYADLLFGRHLWATFIGRYAWQLKDVELMRITDTPSDVFTPAFREREVTRDLGDYFEIEARPRYVLNDAIGFSGMYLYRHKRQDHYTGRYVVPATETGGLGEVTLDASTMDVDTEIIEHRVGAGLTFSTTAAFARGRAALPVEVSLLHLQSVRGFGRRTPKLQSDQVQVRFYTRLFGAPTREAGRGTR